MHAEALANGIDPQTAQAGSAPTPYNAASFERLGVLDVWRRYDGILSWGKGQTLAVLDDGCDLSVPQWQAQLPWGPKVVATFNAVEGGDDPSPRPPAYHGTTVGYPSSLNHDGVLGVAYNNQVAHVRAVTVIRMPKDESQYLATALQWVLANHERYNITAANLSPVDRKAHTQPLAGRIDEPLHALRQANVWVSAPTGNLNQTNGICWPACAQNCFAIGAALPGAQQVHHARCSNVDLLAVAPATSSSNAYAAACAMLLREAIEKAAYNWQRDADNLPAAMMKIFQRTGTPIFDPATGLTFRELNLAAAVDAVFTVPSA